MTLNASSLAAILARISVRRAGMLILVVAIVSLPSPKADAAEVGIVTKYCAGITPNSHPADITAGPEGLLWFTEYDGGIGSITPEGTIKEYVAGLTPMSYLQGIAAGPDGNLWFTGAAATEQIGRITPHGTITQFSEGIPANSDPSGITAGPDGDLWFAEYDGNQIGRISPDGVVTEFSEGITPRAGLGYITFGREDDVWFTEEQANNVARMTANGVVTEFSTGITPNSGPSGIVAGAEGDMWFTEDKANNIARITPQGLVSEFSSGLTPNSGPSAIALGLEGDLWFTQVNANQIGRITPQGAITEFPASPETFDYPLQLTVGNEGDIWFIDATGCIYRMTTGYEGPPAHLTPSPSTKGYRPAPGVTQGTARISIKSHLLRLGPLGYVRVVVACGVGIGACTGTLRLSGAVWLRTGGHLKRKEVALGTASFSAAPQTTETVRLRLDRVGLRLVERARKHETVVYAAASSSANSAYRTVTLYSRRDRRS
jgi:streptogramin lyase